MDEETAVAINEVPEQNEVAPEVRLRQELEKEYQARLESEVSKISAEMTKKNKELVETAIERFRKEMAPPAEEDIQKLLEQEYVEFKIEVRTKGKDPITKHFTIAELPVAVEKKIYKEVKRILVPISSDIAALSMQLLEGDAAKKVVQIMNTFEPALDVMIVVCRICLNPFEEDEEVTDDWVRKNLSATMIVKIVAAQMEANKMRDFFSLLFRNSKLLSR